MGRSRDRNVSLVWLVWVGRGKETEEVSMRGAGYFYRDGKCVMHVFWFRLEQGQSASVL